MPRDFKAFGLGGATPHPTSDANSGLDRLSSSTSRATSASAPARAASIRREDALIVYNPATPTDRALIASLVEGQTAGKAA